MSKMQELQKATHEYRFVEDFFRRKFEIPKQWEYPKFSDVVYVNPKTKMNSLTAPYIPMEAVNTQDGSVDYYEERKVDENPSLPKFQDKDILFARITPCTENGKICFIENFKNQGIASSELTVLRPSNKVLPKYLFYFVRSHRIREFAISQMLGTTGRQRVPDSVFKKHLYFELPPIQEQQKIASILSNVDELIHKTDQVIEQIQRLKKGLMQRLLTKGIGHSEFKHADIGKIPQCWKIMKLHDISNKIVDGTHFTPSYIKDGIPFLRIVDIQSDNVDWNSVRKISAKEHNELIKRCKPEKGDILLSKNGTVGITKVIDWDIPFSIFVSLCLIKPRHEIVNNNYLSLILSSDICLRQIRLRSKQGTVTNLHLEEIRELLIPVPPILEQQKIISVSSSIQKKLENENNTKFSQENLKKGLMQKLLTGKIRVKV